MLKCIQLDFFLGLLLREELQLFHKLVAIQKFCKELDTFKRDRQYLIATIVTTTLTDARNWLSKRFPILGPNFLLCELVLLNVLGCRIDDYAFCFYSSSYIVLEDYRCL